VAAAAFYFWRRELKRRDAEPRDAVISSLPVNGHPPFVPIVSGSVEPTGWMAEPPSTGRIELVHPGGILPMPRCCAMPPAVRPMRRSPRCCPAGRPVLLPYAEPPRIRKQFHRTVTKKRPRNRCHNAWHAGTVRRMNASPWRALHPDQATSFIRRWNAEQRLRAIVQNRSLPSLAEFHIINAVPHRLPM
jgi:hypothetical protein